MLNPEIAETVIRRKLFQRRFTPPGEDARNFSAYAKKPSKIAASALILTHAGIAENLVRYFSQAAPGIPIQELEKTAAVAFTQSLHEHALQTSNQPFAARGYRDIFRALYGHLKNHPDRPMLELSPSDRAYLSRRNRVEEWSDNHVADAEKLQKSPNATYTPPSQWYRDMVKRRTRGANVVPKPRPTTPTSAKQSKQVPPAVTLKKTVPKKTERKPVQSPLDPTESRIKLPPISKEKIDRALTNEGVRKILSSKLRESDILRLERIYSRLGLSNHEAFHATVLFQGSAAERNPVRIFWNPLSAPLKRWGKRLYQSWDNAAWAHRQLMEREAEGK